MLSISNNTSTANNNSVNNDSGEIFGSPKRTSQSKEEGNSFSMNYETSRNEIIHKLIDKLIRAKSVEEYWNASAIL